MQTINVVENLKLIERSELSDAIVDSGPEGGGEVDRRPAAGDGQGAGHRVDCPPQARPTQLGRRGPLASFAILAG